MSFHAACSVRGSFEALGGVAAGASLPHPRWTGFTATVRVAGSGGSLKANHATRPHWGPRH
eukprot:14750658-Alexandrium_andersonii.AAC.1